MKRVFYKKSKTMDWLTGVFFGSLQAASIYAFSSTSPEKTAILASLAFTFSTVITAHNDMFQRLFKSGKKLTNVYLNYVGTYLPFAISYMGLVQLGYVAGIIEANEAITSSHELVQQLYNVFGVGIIAKYVSESYKAFPDAVSSAKYFRGRLNDININFNLFGKKIRMKLAGPERFTFLYQGWHLLRSTFKNIALESAVTGGILMIPLLNIAFPTLEVGGFEFIGKSHGLLIASWMVGTASSYALIKAFKLHKKSEKGAQILKELIPFRKTVANIGNKISTLAKKFPNCNGLFRPNH